MLPAWMVFTFKAVLIAREYIHLFNLKRNFIPTWGNQSNVVLYILHVSLGTCYTFLRNSYFRIMTRYEHRDTEAVLRLRVFSFTLQPLKSRVNLNYI
jgi:hypothetical protein